MRRLIWILVTALLAGVLLITTAQSTYAKTNYGMGGSSSFPAGTEFVLQPGDSLPPTQSIQLQNTGSDRSEVEVTAVELSGKVGVVVTPERDRLTLAPGQAREIPFALEVVEGTAAGRYKMYLEGKQTNVPPKEGGGSTFAPAFAVQFFVLVSGDAARVTVRAVDTDTGQALRGRLTVSMPRKKGGAPLPIRRVQGTELRTSVAPGKYVAGFEVPGLTQASLDFEIAKDEDLTIDIAVTSVTFAAVAAQVKAAGQPSQTVDLLAAVSNKVEKIKGPVTVEVGVRHDEVQLETVLLQQLPVLPTGTSNFRQSFVPAAGWQPGTYYFTYRLIAPQFEVEAAEIPMFEVPSPFPWIPVLAGISGLIVLALLWLVWRRLRRATPADAGVSQSG